MSTFNGQSITWSDGKYENFYNPNTNSRFSGSKGDWNSSLSNAYNYWLWQQQNAQEIANWQMKNEYDAPEAQMARFQKAGLNPNLIYGQQNLSGSTPGVGSPAPARPTNYKMENTLSALGAANQMIGQIMGVVKGAREFYDYTKYGMEEHSLRNSLLESQGFSARDSVDMARIDMAYRLSKYTNGPVTMTSQDGHQFTINYNDSLDAAAKIAGINQKQADTANKNYIRNNMYPWQTQYWQGRAGIAKYDSQMKNMMIDLYDGIVKQTDLKNPFLKMLLWKAFTGVANFDMNSGVQMMKIFGML